ncbi:exodeoxyribonuclease III [Methanogenium organophilum]|uniref:Exodeoxyribonuclease III n=1 Tax=Methanogenium organophilum TaxID=2199 RepID=A0A9X9S4T6_METOG|nr:exodeoxyribonuclease III [Methanogenium organophilum]WAI00920.1 exodeoxyribonuclease III [Methanogenium organophilum]
MKIISWNVNGIRAVARKGNLQEIFENERPDVLCLQETKAHPDQLTAGMRHPEGYFSYFSWAEKRGYSGVATFSLHEVTSFRTDFSESRFGNEGRILITEHPDFLLYNIYFPNGKASKERLQYKMDFYQICLADAVAQVENGRNVIICGDVNTAHTELDLARPKENAKVSGFLPEERAWIDRLVDAGFTDAFRLFESDGGHYSWWDLKSRARERNVGWRIDYFFVNEALVDRIESATLLTDVYGSDHCPVCLELL